MSFDRLAPHYRWMEWLLAGGKLQRCRTALLSRVPEPRRVLLMGEGNGRFLVALLRAYPRARVTCVDASAGMLSQARTRLRAKGLDPADVEWIHADALIWAPPPGQFDLVVSHFFLDCFDPARLEAVLSRLSAAATSDARWLLADFCAPARGWLRWRALLILRAMYLFFRRATHLPARELTSPDAGLARCGFSLCERRLSEWGLLHSDLWIRAGRNRE